MKVLTKVLLVSALATAFLLPAAHAQVPLDPTTIPTLRTSCPYHLRRPKRPRLRDLQATTMRSQKGRRRSRNSRQVSCRPRFGPLDQETVPPLRTTFSIRRIRLSLRWTNLSE